MKFLFIRWLSFACECLTDSAADDRIFPRLQHPDSHHQRIRVRRNALVGWLSGVGIEFDRGGALAQLSHDLPGRNSSHGRIKEYQQVRYVISDPGNNGFASDGGNS